MIGAIEVHFFNTGAVIKYPVREFVSTCERPSAGRPFRWNEDALVTSWIHPCKTRPAHEPHFDVQ